MKKNPAIKEDNKARQFASVQKVVINNTSSGTSLWVPEDIAETDELSVTENGVYCAYDDNVFGYSQVVVNVSESLNDRSEKDKAIGKITGTNPDTGDTESYGVDEDGNLTKEVLPSGLPQAIHIVIAPTKKKYDSGETLDFSGIHVYLLDGEGHQWTSDEYPTGEIPFDELLFPVTIAEGGEVSKYWKASLDGKSITFSSEGGSEEYDAQNGYVYETTIQITGEMYLVRVDGGYPKVIFKDNTASLYAKQKTTYMGFDWGTAEITITSANASADIASGNITYYYATIASGSSTFVMSEALFPPYSNEGFPSWQEPLTSQAAELLFHGNITRADSSKDIPVQWIRLDGKTLEDTYSITVRGESQSGNESGGSSSGGEHSGGDF